MRLQFLSGRRRATDINRGSLTDGLLVEKRANTLDARPLPKARIVFQPSGPDSSPSIAQTRDDGTFELMYRRDLAGAMIGAHTAKITTAGLMTDDSGKETVVPEKVPPRFNKNSRLTFEVKPGENTFEIPLDSKPDPVRKLPPHRGGSFLLSPAEIGQGVCSKPAEQDLPRAMPRNSGRVKTAS
ncbi:hypothetical protein Pan44_52970 [Caulifigura coniformis]|uniref:Uncharacterized protein n=1 Tax=Caulifigura coniformis TaxID=2527983 RepID=A0A517SM77_9PLAN|nr:hypothetical protein [Caulifigura coniformis]QDT57229.1 hypothetical protein Pan44_52970 [Caulifigura coniformis]